ncbi:MAG: tRNA uridine-5-carboxymethylaminomethyl(34) synthesis enzyme MnmG [Planctomycetota bacterium]|nr:tRNA uridine-5-carboxymethylaminomethyl(34) synthesis enzyme MnmG [Planctomycetota bacterium]
MSAPLEPIFDVIVIGGGHAGVEAAWAAANMLESRGGRIALVTLDASKIGVMSCNPAIGGLAKGQLVREIDAMGGLMGLATDATGIQFRVLNTSKGAAVRGPRAQCDKHAYARAVQRMIAARSSISVFHASVEDILLDQEHTVRGVIINGSAVDAHLLGDQYAVAVPRGTTLSARAVVLTTGTFMRGLMHTGQEQSQGGRFGEAAAVGISGALSRLGFELGRLKTGTPPRLRRGSIRWDELVPQYGDSTPVPFSDLSDNPSVRGQEDPSCPSMSRFPVLPQVECRQTRTTLACHQLIRENLHRAPMYSGQIESVGPRYCPSIEDKVVRFADRDSHGVFLEPESLEDDWIYCNGVSTSLPRDVQDVIIRSMPGCEQAEILRYGYAVEYDMVRPHQIFASGMTKSVRGLFLAGQINGTSGYEEAAAQGLVAGINAARLAMGLQPDVLIGRDQGYIGVMMDDLVTKTPVEPYRMFTSRAEHRLMLRADNAADRLTPLAQELGLLNTKLGSTRLLALDHKRAVMSRLHEAIASRIVDGQSLDKMIRADVFELEDLRAAVPELPFERGPWMTALADRRYEAYIIRQKAEIRRQSELEHRSLPADFDFLAIANMRTEAKLSLHKFRPATFGQASRLEGITPADITILSILVRSRARQQLP